MFVHLTFNIGFSMKLLGFVPHPNLGLKALIQAVCKNSEPAVSFSSRSREQAVLISLEDYQAMAETTYLLRSPANRKHLERSLKEAQSGKLVTFPTEDL